MENKYLSRVFMLIIVSVIAGVGTYFTYPYLPHVRLAEQRKDVTNPPRDADKPGSGTQLAMGTGAMKKFESLEQLQEFLSNNTGFGYSYGRFINGSAGRMTGVAPMVPEVAPMRAMPEQSNDMGGVSLDFPSGFAAFASNGDYSATNVQVQGVDEADIVKTDGKYIYVVSNQNVVIVDAYPAASGSVLSKIEFQSAPQNIFINKDRLLAYGSDHRAVKGEMYKSYPSDSGRVFVSLYDISDRNKPVLLRDVSIEGWYMNSRMIGEHVYLVTAKSSYGDADPMLPRILEGEKPLNDPSSPDYVFPNVYYFDAPYQSANMVSVHAVKLSDATANIATESFLMSAEQQLYMSLSNLYLTYVQYVSEDQLMFDAIKDIFFERLGEKERARIAEIEAAPGYILKPYEKSEKLLAIVEPMLESMTREEQIVMGKQMETRLIERYAEIQKEIEKTIIHKIAIDGGVLEYKGRGQVPGYVLNQYSMDEDGDTFRIATTKNATWFSPMEGLESSREGESYSNLYVLDSDLKIIGSVERLAPGERIFSVRFMQNRAYMVTFRQVDPFFVIDLSDARKPKVLGELKIPGFSNYMHPYDDTTIIGVGRDADDSGVARGVKISLFDVSDVSNPREAAQYVFSDASSSSDVEYDPKAFLFSRERNLLVLPVYSQILPGDDISPPNAAGDGRLKLYWSNRVSRAHVFNITNKSISHRGVIEHPSAADQGYYAPSGVRRGLYINEILYTLSHSYLKASRQQDLGDVNIFALGSGEAPQPVLDRRNEAWIGPPPPPTEDATPSMPVF